MKIRDIIIAAITAVICVFITSAVIESTRIKPMKQEIARQDQRIEKQTAVIFELAKQEKYKIENRFEKLKPKESTLVISLDNKLTPMVLDSITMPDPQPSPAGDNGFWKKLKFW